VVGEESTRDGWRIMADRSLKRMEHAQKAFSAPSAGRCHRGSLYTEDPPFLRRGRAVTTQSLFRRWLAVRALLDGY
jgi:hypothetical protein